jgi:hypothetical protein
MLPYEVTGQGVQVVKLGLTWGRDVRYLGLATHSWSSIVDGRCHGPQKGDVSPQVGEEAVYWAHDILSVRALQGGMR